MEAKRNESAAEAFARAHIQINAHSSIRIEAGELVLYVDPFQLKQAPQDADLVFFTHDHRAG